MEAASEAAAFPAAEAHGRRRRLGDLAMIVDPEAAARIEAAFDGAQLKSARHRVRSY